MLVHGQRLFREKEILRIIRCPVCNDNQISKAFSTFAIRKYNDRREETKEEKLDPRQAYQVLQVITDYVNKNLKTWD